MEEQRVREIVREELVRQENVEAAAGTTAFTFKPFRGGRTDLPESMERRRGKAGYFPIEKA